MTLIKNKWFKIYNRLIVLTLSIIGFLSSCMSTGSKYGPPPNIAKYGAPLAKFILKGTVISEDNSKVISNIKINMDNNTVYSDINGGFRLEKTDSPENNTLTISFQDEDGPVNRVYFSMDTIIDFKGIPFTGGDGEWNEGEATKEINIKLKPKD